MKRMFIFLFVLLLPFYGELDAAPVKDGDVVTIPLEEGDNDEDSKNNPRSVLAPSISCHYSHGIFQFAFFDTFENVVIRVENITTGETWIKYMDLYPGVEIISTSATDGNYIISVYADTDCYYGYFQK